ncbi:MAG: LamG-like jellyroll fold domain-containing protein [Planctomycetota bacterium]|jgi:hypothetical protein
MKKGIILNLVFLLAMASLANADPNLVSWWKFDEVSGRKAYDSAGDNDGDVSGATWTTGQIDGALSFSGIGDGVLIQDSPELSPPKITIAVWIYPNDISRNFQIVSKFSPGNPEYLFDNRANNDALRLASTFGGTWDELYSNDAVLTAGTWQHVAVTWDGSTGVFYVNDINAGQDTSSGDLPDLASPVTIGYKHYGSRRYFNGLIDDVRIYNRALSAGEIRQLYWEGLRRKAFEPNPKDGETDVLLDAVLSWSVGAWIGDVNGHDVYLGTNYNDVNDATTASSEYQGRQDANVWDPCGLNQATTYYWRIDELNENYSSPPGPVPEPPNGVWKGDVWTFRTVLPLIELSATHFEFTALESVANPNDQVLTISNSGGGTLNWTSSADCNWLTAAPNSGSSTGEADDVNLSVDISFLTKGVYGCNLTISDTDAPNSPQIVGVDLIVYDPNELLVPSEYPTIQAAIDAAFYGDTVIVADGTYTGEGNRDIDFLGKSITVRSGSGPEDCIIDCQHSGRGFYFRRGEDANSVLDGFTITRGYIYGSWRVGVGGAIRCRYSSSPTIKNCIFTDNSAGWDGGAIDNRSNSSPTITNCIFTKNSAIGNDGGAINNEDGSNPTITNCTFSGNRAYDWGGAIRNLHGCNPTIINCAFSGNSSDDGGAMFYFNGCYPVITNCTLAGNLARNGNALATDTKWLRNKIQMTNCILADGGSEIYKFDNSTITITYSNVQGGYPGSGNIDADPCFVEPGCWVDVNDPNIIVEPNDPNAVWAEGDYHLLRTSPCVDAASNVKVFTDIEGNARPFDFLGVDNNGELPEFDMGAYELVPVEAKMQLTPQMLNCSGKVKWVKAHITLPEGFYPEDVDINEPAVAYPMEAESEYITALGGDKGPVRLEVVFGSEAFCDSIIDDYLDITVIGSLTTGQYFQGTDTIKIRKR